MVNILDNSFCKSCSVKLLVDHQDSSQYCPICGEIVVDTTYDFGREHSFFEDGEKNDRIKTSYGSSTREINFYTEISSTNRDYNGKSIDRSKGFQNFKRWNYKIKSNENNDKNIIQANTEIDRIINQLGVSKGFKTEILNKYIELLNSKFSKGKTLSGLICAITYLKLKQKNTPFSLDQLTALSKVRKRRITKLYKQLLLLESQKIEKLDIEQYIRRYSSLLNDDQEATNQIINRALVLKNQYSTKFNINTNTWSAACVFISQLDTLDDSKKLTLKNFSAKIKITEVTLKLKIEKVIKNYYPEGYQKSKIEQWV